MMKSLCSLCCLLSLLSFDYAYASLAQVRVIPQGETIVISDLAELKVQVKIKTREVEIGKPSDRRPKFPDSSCTYSKYPCSVVDRIEITVNGAPLFIPRSAFCDLADLTRAEIKAEKKRAVLTLYGGDASESYIVNIEFDASQIIRRTLSSAISQGQPLQETTYRREVVGD